MRTVSLNAHYIVVFKNARDGTQIQTLAYQMFPVIQRHFYMHSRMPRRRGWCTTWMPTPSLALDIVRCSRASSSGASNSGAVQQLDNAKSRLIEKAPTAITHAGTHLLIGCTTWDSSQDVK